MDEERRKTLDDLGREAGELIDEVDAATDEYATHSTKMAARAKVEDVARRYREAIAGLSEMDQLTVDRTIGRKVRDLQKVAASLPVIARGNPAAKPADTSFFATRAGLSSRQPVHPGDGALPPGTPKLRVTAEVDAWCGPCGQLRTHVIAAMVGDEPAQVVCQSCGSRHKYRLAPARPKAERAPAAATRRGPATAAEVESQRRAKERSALIDELQAAQNVRPYAPRDRYRVGEFIQHPEHGRGKIENTLPRSMLVRFAGGLKSVKLA